MALNTNSIDLEKSSSQYLSITDGSQTGLDITGDLTMECWVKLEQLPSTAGSLFGIQAKWDDTGVDERSWYWYILHSDDKMYLDFSNNGSSDRCGGHSDVAFTGADVGTWRHLAVSVDVSAGTRIFYIDGSAVSTTDSCSVSGAIHSGAATFLLGALGSGSPAVFFDGLIDEFRVWNDIRTPTEIDDNKGIQLVGDEAGLVAYWRLNNDYLDQTSNNNDLSATGSPVFSVDVPFPGVAVEGGLPNYKNLLGVGR